VKKKQLDVATLQELMELEIERTLNKYVKKGLSLYKAASLLNATAQMVYFRLNFRIYREQLKAVKK
jgi:hypothetical protein